MKLEVGKFYRTRDGRKVGPIETYGDSISYPFMAKHTGGTTVDTYTPDGLYWRGSTNNKHDIVSEWIEGPVRTETIERKVIVPGAYGRFVLNSIPLTDKVFINVTGDSSQWTAEDLDKAAKFFTALAEAKR